MPWWEQNNLRMIQCNLRDIDGAMDVNRLIEDVKGFHANALMVGAGGITSFFPSKLSYQTPSPYLKGDVLGEIVRKGHENGLRIFARFDFSKTHERLFADNPQWYYRSAQGEPIRFGETVQTCVNGPYQRELSLNIIEEVLRAYPVDGIFFNMFGYQTKDYANTYHGICQCESCKSMFRAYSGMELPLTEDASEPALPAYREFQAKTVMDSLDRIADMTKAVNPEVAICTYHHHRVDIIRDESNSAVDRPYPFWLYSASENCQSVEDTWEDKLSSNVAINAVDIFYRFMGVSPHLTKLRLYQNMAAGSGLDWCIIGVFEGYPDAMSYAAAREVFAFHEKNERYYGHMESIASVALVRPARGQPGHREYLGIYRMLKEAHIPFDAIRLDNPAAVVRAASSGKTILLPDIRKLPEDILAALRCGKARVIGTGKALADDPDALLALFGVQRGGDLRPARPAYLKTDAGAMFPSLAGRQWVWVDGDFNLIELDGACGELPLIAPAAFGPPEKCYGHELRNDCFGLAYRDASAYFPWAVGALYYQHGYKDHKKLFLDALGKLRGGMREVETDAPACVEIFLNKIGEGECLLQLANLSGFNGTTFVEPLPIHDLSVRVCLPGSIRSVRALHDDTAFSLEDGVIKIGRLGAFAAYVLEME